MPIQQDEKTTDEAEPRNVTMYSEQWAVVDEVNERFGLRNTSSALRLIINDYRRLRAQESERLQSEQS